MFGQTENDITISIESSYCPNSVTPQAWSQLSQRNQRQHARVRHIFQTGKSNSNEQMDSTKQGGHSQ